MQQLPLDLPAPAPPSLENFIAGDNGEALALMHALARGERPVSPIVLCGPGASGKSHLLQALPGARPLHPGKLPAADHALDNTLFTLDSLDAWDDKALAELFLLLNRLRALPDHAIVIAASQPPDGLRMRDDLRTRLAAGLVLAMHPLSDEDLGIALKTMMRERGLGTSDALIRRMLTHHTRDIRYLSGLLDALDRYGLARGRPLTSALLREFEQSRLSVDRR